MSLFLYFFRVTTHRVICSNLQALPGGVRSWLVLKSTVAQSNFCGREPILHSSIVVVGRSQEDRQMWLCPDVASLTVNQFDRCNLFWRSVVRYGTGKNSYSFSHSPLLRMLDLSQ